MACASLLLAALLLAAPRVRLDAAADLGAHVGSDTPDPPNLGAPRGLELTPRLRALVDDGDADLSARYAPRLLLRDAGASSALGLRHDGLLAATLRRGPALRWLFSERFRYGRNDLVLDPGASRPFDLFEAVPPVIPDELVTDTGLGFSLAHSRTLSINASAGYAAYGGFSAASRQQLPFQQGPQLYAGLDQELTRNDRLSTELYSAYTSASNGRQNGQLKLTEGLRRLFSATARAQLSAGLSAVRRSGGAEGPSLTVFPVAVASAEHELLERTRRLELRGLVSVAPHQSRLTAQLLERAELAGSLRWFLRDAVSLRGRAGAARELGEGGTKLFLGGLDLAIELRRDLSVAAGAETLWQQVPAQGSPSAFRWLAFTALRFGARDLL